MTFTAEKTDSGDQLFATFKVDASSVHYPLGYIVWGADSATQNVTSTSAPFPVQIFQGGASTAPVFVDQVGYVAPSTTVTVTGYTAPSTTVTLTAGTVTVGNDTTDPVGVDQIGYVAPSTTVTITGYVAPSTTVSVTAGTITVGNDTTDPVGVDQIGYVAPSTTVTVTGYVAPSTTFTQTGYVAPSTTVTVSNDSTGQIGTVVQAIAGQTGALQLFTTTLSSAATTVASAAARLYGYHIGNSDTDTDVYVKVYSDDSAGVTLGTTAAKMDLFIPFGGGAIVNTEIGWAMDSGISIASAGAGGSTDHTTPGTSPTVTVWYQ